MALRRAAIVSASVLAVLLPATASYAYWHTTGQGTGSAIAGTSAGCWGMCADTTAPAVTIPAVSKALLNASDVSTTVTWQANENGTFSVRVPSTGCAVGAGTTVSSGSYDTTPANVATVVNSSALVQGANTVRACVTDAAGNSGYATTTVTKDTTPPNLSTLTVAQRQSRSGGATVTGTLGTASTPSADNPTVSVSVTLASGSGTPTAGSVTYGPSAGAFSVAVNLGGNPSTTEVTVTQTDAAGNFTVRSVQIART
jgi:large repetitive protein